MNSNLIKALNVAQTGIPVFACKADKSPATKNGFKDATTNLTAIKSMFKNYKEYLVGIPTGEISQTIVLDVDVDLERNINGNVGLSQLEESLGPLPPTRVINTRRGGRHIYFNYPGSKINNSASKLANGIDVRGDGGYVILWEDNNTPLADLPQTWLNAVLQPKKKVVAQPEKKFSEGARNDSLYKYGCSLRGKGLDDYSIFLLVQDKNLKDCTPPLEDEEVSTICDSISSLPIGNNIAIVENEEWRQDLIVKTTIVGNNTISVILPRPANYALIFHNDQQYTGKLKFDEFSQQITLNNLPMIDYDIMLIKADLDKRWIPAGSNTNDVVEGTMLAAKKLSFHPIRKYLEGLKWDGTSRIGKFFSTYCGSKESNYHLDVALSLFTSACARIYHPGCRVDTMVILEGDQGVGKTSLWPILFGREYTAEVTASLDSKDFFLALRGKWCLDFGELSAIITNRVDKERIKQVITQPADHYREPYARKTLTIPRQCVFVGGTNQSEWMTDNTGNRRYLPVTVVKESIRIKEVEEDKDQLWAEALQCFKSGHQWWNIRNAAERQEESFSPHPWEEPILGWLKDKTEFSMKELLEHCLYKTYENQTHSDKTIVGGILKRLGWTSKQITKGEIVGKRVYQRK